MWVVLLVSIHLLLGPDVSVVGNFGPYRDRDACENDLNGVRAEFSDEDTAAWRRGELVVFCIKVSDYRDLATPEPGGG